MSPFSRGISLGKKAEKNLYLAWYEKPIDVRDEIKKLFEKSKRQILEIKSHSRNQTDKFWKSKNHLRNQKDKFWKSKKPFEKSNGQILEIKEIIREVKRTNFGTDKTRIETYNYFSDTPWTP